MGRESGLKIQLAGLYYDSNLGDAVICDCVSWLLKRYYPDAEIRIVDLYGKSGFAQSGVIPYSGEKLRKRQRKLSLVQNVSSHTPVDLEYYREKRGLEKCLPSIQSMIWEEADCCVFAGGQIMMDWLALEVTAIAETFLKKERNVYFTSAGVGPLCSPRIRKIYHNLFMDPHVGFLSVRDHADDFNRYFRLPPSRQAVEEADCGLWADEVYQTRASLNGGAVFPSVETVETNHKVPDNRKPGREALKGAGYQRPAGSEPIGVGFYYPNIVPPQLVLNHMQVLIRYLEEHQIPWQAFTNGSGEDAGFGEYVLSTMPDVPDRHRAELEDTPKSPAELVRKIGSFRGILSFRLHSHVIAASLGVPSAAFVWDDKLNSFFRMMGYPERSLKVGTDPEICMEVLERAMEEGWNRERILTKRQESIDALLEAMKDGESGR